MESTHLEATSLIGGSVKRRRRQHPLHSTFRPLDLFSCANLDVRATQNWCSNTSCKRTMDCWLFWNHFARALLQRVQNKTRKLHSKKADKWEIVTTYRPSIPYVKKDLVGANMQSRNRPVTPRYHLSHSYDGSSTCEHWTNCQAKKLSTLSSMCPTPYERIFTCVIHDDRATWLKKQLLLSHLIKHSSSSHNTYIHHHQNNINRYDQ